MIVMGRAFAISHARSQDFPTSTRHPGIAGSSGFSGTLDVCEQGRRASRVAAIRSEIVVLDVQDESVERRFETTCHQAADLEPKPPQRAFAAGLSVQIFKPDRPGRLVAQVLSQDQIEAALEATCQAKVRRMKRQNFTRLDRAEQPVRQCDAQPWIVDAGAVEQSIAIDQPKTLNGLEPIGADVRLYPSAGESIECLDKALHRTAAEAALRALEQIVRAYMQRFAE